MKKTWSAGSACIRTAVVLLMMAVFMMASALQVTADTGTVKYQVTGGEITFDKSAGTVTACDKTVTEATIPAEIDGTAVKQIGQNAFSGCSELASVTLPEGLTRIATRSFDYTKITSISVPATVTYVDYYAFARAGSLECMNVAEGNDTYCSKDGVVFDKEMTMLKRYPPGKTCDEYTVPSGVTQICEGAFSYSRNVSEIVMPDSVYKIGSDAFRECSGLKKVDLPDSIKTVPQRCFYDCAALTEIKLPSMLSDIGTSAFWQCGSLKSVTIPENVTEISDRAFAYCTALDEVIIPESVATVTPGGTVQACGAGTAVITATAAENEYYKSVTKKITVNVGKGTQTVNAPASFTKTFGAASFSIGVSAKTPLKYRSSDTKTVTVSSSGKVTLKNPGKAYITVTAAETKDYRQASRTVRISSSLKKPSLTLQAQKGRKVRISWNRVPGADGYRLYLYDSCKKKYTKLITRNSKVKSVLHRGLKAGKTYRYKVRAYRKVNGKVMYSSYSEMKKARVKK